MRDWSVPETVTGIYHLKFMHMLMETVLYKRAYFLLLELGNVLCVVSLLLLLFILVFNVINFLLFSACYGVLWSWFCN